MMLQKTHPPAKRYAELEAAFLMEAHRRGEDVAELDLRIWRSYSRSPMPKHHLKQAATYKI